MLGVANTCSCVGPQNKIGHPAHRATQLMQVPLFNVRGIKIVSKNVFLFSVLASQNVEYDLSCGLRKGELWYDNDLWNE